MKWLWAGTERTYAGQTVVGKLHLVQTVERENGVFICSRGGRWATLCERYAPRAGTRGVYAGSLPEAVPCKPCWRKFSELVLADVEEAHR